MSDKLWKIRFVLSADNSIDREAGVCFILADTEEKALENFHKWIDAKLHEHAILGVHDKLEDSFTVVEMLESNNEYGVVYQNVYDSILPKENNAYGYEPEEMER